MYSYFRSRTLARALERKGDTAGAMAYYKQVVEQAALVWCNPDLEFPGLWADSLLRYSRLARDLKSANAAELARQYLAIRKNADVPLQNGQGDDIY